MASAAVRDVLAVELGELAEVDSILSVERALVDLGPRLRPVDPVWAEALGQLMSREGQRDPVDISRNPDSDRWEVHGAGGHRWTAAGLAEIEHLKVRVHAWNPDAARLREIADLIHRSNPLPFDRAQAVAEAVACYKRMRGIDPSKDGRSASVQVRWQNRLREEAADTNATFALVYGWSAEVAEQLGLSRRAIEYDLLLARRLQTSTVQRLREQRHPILSNASQLRALAKLDEAEQDRIVDQLTAALPAKSVSDAQARMRGANRVASDPAAKNLSAFLGAFSRMSLTEKKGALHELRDLLPAGYQLVQAKPEAAPESPVPAVAIRASVKPDHMVCLECGEKLINLQVHLNAKHQMRFADYLTRWKLPCDYPAVAPYSDPSAALITECDGDLQLILAVVSSWHGKPSKAIEGAVTEAGGVIRFANGTYEMKLARVKATCTAGGLNLISAWQRKAEARLEQAEVLGLRGAK